jgi:uric acid transporter
MTARATGHAASPRPEDEVLPAPQLLGYGLQHVLAMVGGIIAVPLIVGGAAGLEPAESATLVACALLVSGLATILQTIGVPFLGSRLPLVQGISFASVSTMVTIIAGESDGERGLRVVAGAVVLAALVGLVVAPFPAVVTGSIITVIGVSLMPVAAGWITGQPTVAGGENPDYLSPTNLVLSLVTLALVLVMSSVRALARLAVLLGLVLGTLVAFVVGRTSLDGVGDASVVAVPTPFAFGTPLFEVGAIVAMVVVMVVIMVETTADILAVGEVVGTPVDSRRVADGVRADMISSAIAPVLNSFPATAFAQNVGLVALTGVRSRFVVATGGAVLVLLGLSPVLASLVTVIPLPVLGGAGLVLFGTVAASGVRTLARVDFDDHRNLVVVAVSLGFGLLPVVNEEFWSRTPDWVATILGSEISAAALVAFTLNLFFTVLRRGERGADEEQAAAPAAPAAGSRD